MQKETYIRMSKETSLSIYICHEWLIFLTRRRRCLWYTSHVKRDLHICQKRPTHMKTTNISYLWQQICHTCGVTYLFVFMPYLPHTASVLRHCPKYTEYIKRGWYVYVKRDLYVNVKSDIRLPHTTSHPSDVAWGAPHMSNETYISLKRNLHLCQKRPTHTKTLLKRDLCIHVKKDLSRYVKCPSKEFYIYLKKRRTAEAAPEGLHHSCHAVSSRKWFSDLYLSHKGPTRLSKETNTNVRRHPISTSKDPPISISTDSWCFGSKSHTSLAKKTYISLKRDLYLRSKTPHIYVKRAPYIYIHTRTVPWSKESWISRKNDLYVSQKGPIPTTKDAQYLRQKSPLYLYQQIHGAFVQRIIYLAQKWPNVSQKGPICLSKEPYTYVRRRPISTSKESPISISKDARCFCPRSHISLAKETYMSLKRDLYLRQKNPYIYVKETPVSIWGGYD